MNANEIKAITDKAARKATEELHEHLQDLGKKIMQDQEKWLDERMKDLLPPDIYDKARHDDCQEEVAEYINRHKIRLTFIPDSLRIRIDVGGQQYAEFVPRLAVDGEPIPMMPSGFSPSANN